MGDQAEQPLCFCGLRSRKWTSRTLRNPGRDFVCCPKAIGQQCGFFHWLDGRYGLDNMFGDYDDDGYDYDDEDYEDPYEEPDANEDHMRMYRRGQGQASDEDTKEDLTAQGLGSVKNAVADLQTAMWTSVSGIKMEPGHEAIFRNLVQAASAVVAQSLLPVKVEDASAVQPALPGIKLEPEAAPAAIKADINVLNSPPTPAIRKEPALAPQTGPSPEGINERSTSKAAGRDLDIPGPKRVKNEAS